MRIMLLISTLLLLSGCGLRPLYSGGTQGAVAQELGNIVIEPMEGRAGWLMSNALNDRIRTLSRGNDAAARYRLKIALDDKVEGFGLVSNDRITQERRTLRARYQLIDLSSDTIVLDATAGSDSSIDVVSSEYATIAAEDTALEDLTQEVADQIVTRLALYARNRGEETAAQ